MTNVLSAEVIHSKRLIGATIPAPDSGAASGSWISIADSVLTNCDLTEVSQCITVDDAIFIHCNFEGALFAESTLKKASFRNCNFTNLRCVDAVLLDVNMVGCTFSGADFSHTSFKDFTCDAASEQWADTLLWGAIGLRLILPSCYSDTIKWIPGLPSPLYHADSSALGLSRVWLRELSHSSGLSLDSLLALYNEHPEMTPRRFAALATALKET